MLCSVYWKFSPKILSTSDVPNFRINITGFNVESIISTISNLRSSMLRMNCSGKASQRSGVQLRTRSPLPALEACSSLEISLHLPALLILTKPSHQLSSELRTPLSFRLSFCEILPFVLGRVFSVQRLASPVFIWCYEAYLTTITRYLNLHLTPLLL
jgi:hypothetical protein